MRRGTKVQLRADRKKPAIRRERAGGKDTATQRERESFTHTLTHTQTKEQIEKDRQSQGEIERGEIDKHK